MDKYKNDPPFNQVGCPSCSDTSLPVYIWPMAHADVHIIQALRETAARMEKSPAYQWGHMGQCNCGFLAQVVTHQSPRQIHTAAMSGHGDWSEQLHDYCPTTGRAMDDLITSLLEFGFNHADLAHLERLSDPLTLSRLPGHGQHLLHNRKEDVVEYLRAWAARLEDEWAATQPGPSLDITHGAWAIETAGSLSLHYPG